MLHEFANKPFGARLSHLNHHHRPSSSCLACPPPKVNKLLLLKRLPYPEATLSFHGAVSPLLTSKIQIAVVPPNTVSAAAVQQVSIGSPGQHQLRLSCSESKLVKPTPPRSSATQRPELARHPCGCSNLSPGSMGNDLPTFSTAAV